jgi:hypothetical protein
MTVMIPHRLLFLAAMICLDLTSAHAATTISLRPVADSSIFSDPSLANSNFGGGATFTAGGRPLGGMCRGLLEFDIAGSVPAGATINSVSLSLTVRDSPPTSPVPSIFDLNRLTASWAEGNGADRGGSPAGPNQVTWNNRMGSSGSPWTTPGGDFSSVVSASTMITGTGPYTFASTPKLVSDVQSWLDNPGSDFGWILRSENENVIRTIRRFGSRLDSMGSPVLRIQYTLVPEPSAASLLLLGLGALALKRR